MLPKQTLPRCTEHDAKAIQQNSMERHIYIKKITHYNYWYFISVLSLSRQPRGIKKEADGYNLKETDLCSYFKKQTELGK